MYIFRICTKYDYVQNAQNFGPRFFRQRLRCLCYAVKTPILQTNLSGGTAKDELYGEKSFPGRLYCFGGCFHYIAGILSFPIAERSGCVRRRRVPEQL
jgi:hypothetical protein